MQKISIGLIIFWIVVVVAPEFIAALIWGLIIFIGINVYMVSRKIKSQENSKKDYVKFGDYKIFRGKK